MSVDEKREPSENKLLQGRSLSRRRHDLALGIERIGLVPLRFPVFVGVLAIALGIAAAFGVVRIKIDNSLSQLFRSNTPEYKLYAREIPSLPVKRIRCPDRRQWQVIA